MNRSNLIIFTLYRHALRLYPQHLRVLYQDQMLQTVRDADAERTYTALYFWLYLFADLFRSSLKERFRMTHDNAFRRSILFHAVLLGLVLTLMGGAAAVTMQQMLRRGADHPQIEMARSYAHNLATGIVPQAMLPTARVDLQTSLEPFAIFTDENGAPIASSAVLNDRVPEPPVGVFDRARKYQLNLITWQPQPGVRIALVLRRVDGPHPGFVLTGRSLLLVEEQESALRRGTFITWFVLMGLLALGALFLDRAQRAAPAPAPVR